MTDQGEKAGRRKSEKVRVEWDGTVVRVEIVPSTQLTTGPPVSEPLEVPSVPINPEWRSLPPLFARVLRHLAAHGPQTREEIAAAFNMGVGGRLKYALTFMVQMGILNSAGGYSLRIPEGISQEDYRRAVLAWLDMVRLEEAEDSDGD